MKEDDIITFRYEFPKDLIPPPRTRHIPTNQEIQLAMKIMQNNIWLYTSTTPKRILLRRWLWRMKHSIILFYYKHFRRFRIWYHKRTIAYL